MKRKLVDVDDSDTDGFSAFQSQRKRRRRIVDDSSSETQSDDDTIIDQNEDDSNSQQLSTLHISSDGNRSDEPQNNNRRSNRIKHSKKPWDCDACTYKNEKQFTKCEICDTKRTNYNIKDINDDNDTSNSTISNGDDIKTEDNDFKRVRSTKQFRKKKDNKLTKQRSIIDLTQTKITVFTTKSKKKAQKQISSINGNRSRNRYYSNLKKKTVNKKTKLSKTESIESVGQTELLLTKQHKNMERISDESDCVIVKTTKKTKKKTNSKKNKAVKLDKICKEKLETEQWIDKYAPKHIEDLYLHKKKLNDIDSWLCNAFKSSDKCILFLVGQSGIGKTSAIECLSCKYNAKLLCYPTMDSNIRVHHQSVWDNDNTHFMNFSNINRARRNIDIRDETQMNKFDSFLNRSKRFGSLNLFSTTTRHCKSSVSIHKRQIILIKELPYVGQSQYLYRFREIVEKMCNTTRNIVIFEITTEFEGTRDDLQIFGSAVRLHPRVTTIKLNPINKTLMKKCLKHIISAEKMDKCIVNSSALITNIIENEKGDLRNAIQTLQIRLIELLYSKQINQKECLKIGGRESTLSLFHCLGKILYAKKKMDPEDALEKADLNCITFNDLLHENAPDFFVYNEHFNASNHDEPKEVDEFGFEIDLFNDNGFDKYLETLDYFSDADICCEYYNKLRFSDTSTDLRSTVNHIQFGSQLYPAIYAASIASRGYLISHDKQPKLKHKKGGLNAIRKSTTKVMKNLRNELRTSIQDVIVPKPSFNQNEHYVKENELGLLRSFMCHPTSLYTDIFPLISYTKSNIDGVKPLLSELIRTSNWYSQKYEYKKFDNSRFDYIKNKIKYKKQINETQILSDDDKEMVHAIEEYSD